METHAATREEVEQLKRDWLNDATWELAETPGFEAHAKELREFEERTRRRWAAEEHAEAARYAREIGLEDNPTLAAYVRRLERRIARLESCGEEI